MHGWEFHLPLIKYMLCNLDLAWNYKSVLTQFSTGQRTLWLKNLQISHVTLLKRSPLLFIPFNLRCTKGSCWYRFLWFRQMMLGAKISPIFIQEVRENILQVNDFQKVFFFYYWIFLFIHSNIAKFLYSYSKPFLIDGITLQEN